MIRVRVLVSDFDGESWITCGIFDDLDLALKEVKKCKNKKNIVKIEVCFL